MFVRRSIWTLLGLLAVLPAAASEDSPGAQRHSLWEWSGVERVVAVGDLHGAYEKFLVLLEAAELVDAELDWIGGSTHLVVVGDFLDRGSGDLEIVELLMRLEPQAAAAGGRVHALLGNHEVMNLVRDTRYVHPETYRRLADRVDKKVRSAAWRAFSNANLGRVDARRVRLDFQRRFPKGYFVRQQLFDRDGRYGQWLLSRPAILKIDGMVYLHGGLTARFAALGVDEINREIHTALDRHIAAREALEEAGIVGAAMAFVELHKAVTDHLEDRPNIRIPTVDEPARDFLATAEAEILGAEGPLWYRGNSTEDERIEGGRLERSLELLDARAMVVAHSFTGGNKITSRFDGRLLRLDHGIFESRRPLALVVEGGEALVLDSRSRMVMRPVRELPSRNWKSEAEPPVGEPQTERLLAKGEVVESREIGRGSTRPKLVVLARNGQRARGLFKNVEKPGSLGGPADRYEHEVAAYRIDRRLGLGLVPVTVVRELDGEAGSLQSWVEGAVDRAAAREHGLELDKTARTLRQLDRGRLFDSLIGNAHRQDSDILCEVRGDRIYLVDHSQAFPLSRELPEAVEPPSELEPELVTALAALDREWAADALGELLSGDQIEALLARRDRLLQLSELARATPPAEAEAITD